MSFNWDDESTLLLIKKFRENDALWNPENPDYKSRVKRNEALKEIASSFAMDLDIIEVERKLKNLTSQYYRENKKYVEAKKSGENARKPKWFAYEPMDFLRSKCRPTLINEVNSEQAKPLTTTKRSIHIDKEYGDTSKQAKQQSLPTLSTTAERDEAAIFGEFIAAKIRRMDPVTTSTVEHLIHNIIYQAEMGVYSQMSLNTIPQTYFGTSTSLRRLSCQSNSTLNNASSTECEDTTVKIENPP